jgi:hypothetical protein
MTFEGFRTACRRRRSAFGSLREVCRGFGTTSRSFRSRRRRPARASEGFGTAFEGFGTAFEGFGTAFEGFGTAFEGFGTASEGFGTASEGFRKASVDAMVYLSAQGLAAYAKTRCARFDIGWTTPTVARRRRWATWERADDGRAGRSGAVGRNVAARRADRGRGASLGDQTGTAGG